MDKLERYSLIELVDVRDGTHDSPKYVDDGFPLITSKNLINGSVNFENVNFITETDYHSINKRSKVDEGDILYSMIGSIGNYAIVNFEPRFAIKNVALIKFKNSKLSSKYFIHYIKSNEFTTQIEKQSKGGTQKFVTLKILRNIQVPLPSLSQQQKIANILDAADALRQNDKALLAKYDELTKALFLEMFGDPVSNPKEWGKVELKKLGKVVTGSTPPSSKENMFGGDIPFVTPGDLDKNQPYKRFVTDEGALNSRTVNKGSLFVCCIGATIGKTGIARELSSFNQQINAVDWFDTINYQFGFHCFSSLKKELIEKAISTTLPIMKKSEFEKLKMICPPIDLQNQFAERVALIEEQKAIAQTSLIKSEELFNSLLQKAFKGELI